MSAPPQPLEAETARVEEQCYNAVVAGGREVNVARLRLERTTLHERPEVEEREREGFGQRALARDLTPLMRSISHSREVVFIGCCAAGNYADVESSCACVCSGTIPR